MECHACLVIVCFQKSRQHQKKQEQKKMRGRQGENSLGPPILEKKREGEPEKKQEEKKMRGRQEKIPWGLQ